MSVKLLNLESNIGDIGDKFPLAKRNLKASKLHFNFFTENRPRLDNINIIVSSHLLVTRHTSLRSFLHSVIYRSIRVCHSLSLSFVHPRLFLLSLSALTQVCNSLPLSPFAIIVHGVDGH